MPAARSFSHRWLLLLVLLSLLTLTTPVYAATFTVNSTGDASDASAGNGVCLTSGGVCTLRAAIEEANGLAGDDIINFSGVTLVNIGTELAITSNITINGTSVTVDNTGTGRVFLMTNATVFINGMRITGGDSAGNGGGGIRISGGSLTLQSGAVVTGNTAGGGGGGGVYALSSAQVTITGSGTQISGNTDAGNGAGLNLQGGSDAFLLNGAVISGNNGPNSGGGVAVAGTGSTFTVDNATVSGNTAEFSAGISGFSGGSVTLQNGAVISGNNATVGSGGGVTMSGGGSLTVSDTRFESNTAAADGDAIRYSSAANASITRSCFTNNGDTAISNINTAIIVAPGAGNIADANWWGTSWGPRIAGVTGSRYSNGDSITGNGTNGGSNRVDVGWISGGDEDQIPPTGAWLTSPPTINGVTCQVCSAASSLGHGRTCS
ncbi:MAG: CSLREA domain-containing protein [Anaerolineae bacterium]|nr:CSLREA domain-containing protein [Anaerolineae bacterium]